MKLISEPKKVQDQPLRQLLTVGVYSAFMTTVMPIGIMATTLTAVTTLSSPAHASYACKIPKSYYKHVSCTSNSRYFLAVKDSGHPVAVIGKDGRRVIDLMRYTKVDANKLRGGVLPVMRGGKVGYVNMSGREVVPAVYDVIRGDKLTSGWARAAYNDRIIVKKNGKFGIISTSNAIILPFDSSYKTISDYKSGKAKITRGNETLVVDSNARRIGNTNSKKVPSNASTSKNTNSDTSANSSTNSNRESISAKAPVEIWQPKERDGKWGFVNSRNVPMITFSFDAVMPFSEGLAAVRMGENWGFVDLAGSLVIPFRFDESGIIRDNQGNKETYMGVPPLVFKDGKAWIGNLNNGTKLCIDKIGVNVACADVSIIPEMTIPEESTPEVSIVEPVVNQLTIAPLAPLQSTTPVVSQPANNTTEDTTQKTIEPNVLNANVLNANILEPDTSKVETLQPEPLEPNVVTQPPVPVQSTTQTATSETSVFALRKIFKAKVFKQ